MRILAERGTHQAELIPDGAEDEKLLDQIFAAIEKYPRMGAALVRHIGEKHSSLVLTEAAQ